MNYKDFIKTKQHSVVDSGFDIHVNTLHSSLFFFQKYAVRVALSKGRFALFFDCGLGKTFMQLEWAKQVFYKTNKPVIILSPLAVVQQTIKEANRFGIDCHEYKGQQSPGIFITNYEQLKNIDTSIFTGVVLDESSILKGQGRKTSTNIIESFSNTPYKLACTATPSPNDHIELGQHVEFLGWDTYESMKSKFFVQDVKLKTSNKWRLKKHAQSDFWKYVCQWSMSCDNPSTLGFHMDGYDLPEINYIEHIIPVDNETDSLFNDVAVSATDLNKDLRRSLPDRVKKAAELVNGSSEQWIVWGLQNKETAELQKHIIESVNVQGSDKPELKAKNLNGFANGDFKCLVTKTSIASFGMNYQNCHNMIFCSYDFKFEQFYQAVRRCYRFGQKETVNVHILIPESQKNVRKSILEKQSKHFKKIKEMSKYSSIAEYKKDVNLVLERKEVSGNNWKVILADTFEEIKYIKDESIGYSLFSPPFKDLYTYSDDPRDLSNVGGDKEFYEHFSYLVPELYRVIKPGRLLSMHIMQGTTSIGKHGFYSIVDFRGELIRLFQSFGFIFHAEKMIRKNPQLAAVRTKNHQLLHATTKKDSSVSRPGLADYIITFRKPGENTEPIRNDIAFEDWVNIAEPYEYDNEVSIEALRNLHEPLWTDINESDVISGFRKAKSERDEKHLTPTQLSVIRNCILLWSNKGDEVLDPFGGVGSIGFQSIKMGRKSTSIELKESYFDVNVRNHRAAVQENAALTLF